jgi:hydrogenase expression/formation protein HypE
MYVANEGRFVAMVAPEDESRAVNLLKKFPVSSGACSIGRITESTRPLVVMKSRIGASRIVDMISGEQLPRIC